MNDPVAILKRDHREVAQMLKTLDSSKPGARRRQTVDKLTRELELHMEIEERDVYPVVQRVVGEEEAQEAGVEHRLAREGLAELRRLVDEPGFGAAVHSSPLADANNMRKPSSASARKMSSLLGK